MSFKKTGKDLQLPLSVIWLMNSISEYKGKRELYKKQSPQLLKTLLQIALIQSVESSNRIEGVTVEKERLKPLVLGKAKPKTRSEEEITGYRNALHLIHKRYDSLEITPETIKYLHKLCLPDANDAGQWKNKDNEIIRRNPDGSIEVIYKPLSAKETPQAIENLCLLYKQSIEQEKYPLLYAIACLILDFLCVHPFRDGNGRVSRLLTLLVLYQQRYEVGRYISIERIIEESKETYYEVLNKSSSGWKESKYNIEPWLNYFLGTIISAYREFEERAKSIESIKGVKTEIVIKAIGEEVGDFSLSDIIKKCPGISREMIKIVFKKLRNEKKIICLGKGQSAKWRKIAKIFE